MLFSFSLLFECVYLYFCYFGECSHCSMSRRRKKNYILNLKHLIRTRIQWKLKKKAQNICETPNYIYKKKKEEKKNTKKNRSQIFEEIDNKKNIIEMIKLKRKKIDWLNPQKVSYILKLNMFPPYRCSQCETQHGTVDVCVFGFGSTIDSSSDTFAPGINTHWRPMSAIADRMQATVIMALIPPYHIILVVYHNSYNVGIWCLSVLRSKFFFRFNSEF